MFKKILLGLLIFFVVLLAAAALVPIIFKDDIKAALDKEIAAKVNAKVFYDADQFGLTLFANFPNVTVKLGDFGVVNKAPFEGDTLLKVNEFAIVLDLMSVLTGDKIKINSVLLDEPHIRALVLPTGQSNYDIMISDTSAVQPTTPSEPSKFSIAVNSWEVRNGQIGFIDLQTPMLAKIQGFNHKGSGDFSNTVLDLMTKTTIDSLSVEYDSTGYFNRTRVAANLNVRIDQDKQLYTLSDNEIRLNDFAFAFTGTVLKKPASTVFDLKYAAKETSFKNVLSLIPAVFLKGYEDLKTEGLLAFDGFVKGEQSAGILPQFGLNLRVQKGQMQYPKLPSALTNVNLDFSATHPGGPLELIQTELRTLHFDLGKNPFDAKLKTQGLKHITLDGNVKTKLNLAEVTQAFPVNGLSLKGLFALDATAKGVYDDSLKLIPAVTAQLELMDGYVKSASVPAPVEQLAFVANVLVEDGKPELGKLSLERLRFVLEGEAMEATAQVNNFVNYTYQATLKGKADLGKLTKIYPLSGMTIDGKLIADIRTAGNKADVDAKRWDKLPTSGTMGLENFSYQSPTLKQKVTVQQGSLTLDPQKLSITQCVGLLGTSDYSLTGTVTNYIPFVFADGKLAGKINLKSNKFLANEWTSSDSKPATPAPKTEEAPKPTAEPAEPAISVPKNLDMTVTTDINTLLYDNYVLDQFNAVLIVKNGTVRMEPLAFNTLDGAVRMNGLYDPTQANGAKFTYGLDVKGLSIPKTYTTVSTAQKLAPFIRQMTGLFSSNIKLNGGLSNSLSPDLKTLSGTADIALNQAAINDLQFPAKVNALAKTNLPTAYNLKDLKVSAVIADGFVNFKPFELANGGNKIGVSGRYGLDGTLDYNLKVNVPSGQLGTAAVNALKGYLGANTPNLANVIVDIKVGGTQTKPTYSIANVSTGSGGSNANTAKDLGKAAFDKAKGEAEQRAKAEADRLKQEGEQRAKQEIDRLKQEAERKAKEELEKLKGRFKF